MDIERIYQEIWELARPYYQKGRAYDVPHIVWMMREANRIADLEGLEKKLLLPIVILHDVGYSAVGNNNPNIKDKNSKIAHMAEGARIAEDILRKVDYDTDLSKKIMDFISVHDNWILGDDSPYKKCKEIAVFQDLDFLYSQSSYEIFKKQAASIGKKPEEMWEFWLNDEKLTRRPFCCAETLKLFKRYMEERYEDIKKILLDFRMPKSD